MNSQLVQFKVPPQLAAALDAVAARYMTTRSEIIRQCLLDRLRADGIDPTEVAGTPQEHAA